jgi:hypothetical protein
MGEAQGTLFQPEFNRAVKVQSFDQKITSHAGAILLREADHKLGLVESLVEQITDPRHPDKIRYTATELIRERIYAMALGDEDQDDLDRLAHDPAMRMATWNRPGQEVLDQRLASQPTQSRLIDWLANESGNLEALRHSLFDWTHRHLRSTGRKYSRQGHQAYSDGHAVMRATIDIDSFPINVHGHQQGGKYNGHYHAKVYHPLVASFCVDGDYDHGGSRFGNGFLHAILREGQVHTAQGMNRFTKQVVSHARQMARSFDLRLDAGYTIGRVMDSITDENVRFCGRLKKNPVLERLAASHLARPAGRPPKKGYEKVIELGKYQAKGWKHAQRVILVIVDKPDPKTGQLRLFPRHFFLVTNWPKTLRSGEQLLAHYRKRGTFEDRLGEFNAVIGPHLSSKEFVENEAVMLLSMLAFNLSTILRNELEAATGGSWDLERFQQTVLRAGGRVTKHARRLWLSVESSVSGFWSLLTKQLAKLTLSSLWSPPKGARSQAYIPPPPHAHRSLVLRG